jgi:hypothetical protein
MNPATAATSNFGPLAVLFAAGFAVQQLIELLTTILDLDNNPNFEKYKKAILGVCSFAFGLALACLLPGLRLLSTLGTQSNTATVRVVDVLVTGLVLSAGTEGINSLLKFAKYSKEDKKTSAASKESALNNSVNGVAQSPLARLNRI